jgi:hypothetical protein
MSPIRSSWCSGIKARTRRWTLLSVITAQDEIEARVAAGRCFVTGARPELLRPIHTKSFSRLPQIQQVFATQKKQNGRGFLSGGRRRAKG